MKIGCYYIEVGDLRDSGLLSGYVGKAGKLRKHYRQAFTKEWEAQEVAEQFTKQIRETQFPKSEIFINNAAMDKTLLIEVFVWKVRKDDEVDDDVAVFGIA